MNTATIPTTITPEAADLVGQLGMQAELERMLEHVRQTISRLRRIEIEYGPDYDEGCYPAVLINAYRDPPAEALGDRTWQEFSSWKISTFPPEVFSHFTLLLREDPDHAG